MNFATLREKFAEHANVIKESKDKTARFRASSYDRVVNILESKHKGSDLVTKEAIAQLPLTDYMKTKAIEILDGKKLKVLKKDKAKSPKAKSPKAKSPKTKSPKKQQAKRQIKTKSSSASKSPRSRSSSRSPSKSPKSRSPSKSPKASKSNPKLIKELTNFMGIGESRAKQLIEEGLKNINQLHSKKWLDKLPIDTQTFLKLKPKTPIPHEDIQVLEPYILKLQNPSMQIRLVGSYRREKPISNDIDVMITSNSEDIINEFLTRLKEVLPDKVFPYSKGADKMSLVVDMKDMLDKKDAVYKLDIFRVKPEEEIPMLLYSTGSKEHNILMRRLAKNKGLLLNQKGLFRKTDNTLEKIPDLKNEEDYFKELELDYKEPKDRV